MMILKSFCCCNPLKTGGLTIGVFGIVKWLLIAIGAQICTFDPSIEAGSSGHITLELIFIFAFNSLVANIYLILGVLSEKHKLLFPCLISEFMLLLCFFGIGVIDIGAAFSDGPTNKRVTLEVFAIIISGYIWLCIFSLYKEYKNKALLATDKSQGNVGNQYVKLISTPKPKIATVEAGEYI